MTGRMLYLHALTPVHSGTGQGVGYIDQPVARDRTTGWPILPGSSVKGVLRARGDDIDQDLTKVVFGPETANADAHAGAVWFPDAHLIALPVRSLYGSFAWITSPLVLQHWQRDRVGLGDTTSTLPALDLAEGGLSALVAPGSVLVQGNTLYLEDYDLDATETTGVATLATELADAIFDDPAWRTLFAQRLALVSDFVYEHFVATSLDVVARIRLNERTKTVAQGGLWYEEAVPAESIFGTPLRLGEVKLRDVHQRDESELWEHLAAILDGETIQIGGNASVGRGLFRGILGHQVSTAVSDSDRGNEAGGEAS